MPWAISSFKLMQVVPGKPYVDPGADTAPSRSSRSRPISSSSVVVMHGSIVAAMSRRVFATIRPITFSPSNSAGFVIVMTAPSLRRRSTFRIMEMSTTTDFMRSASFSILRFCP
jgi:hypothetical protein